MALQTFGLHCGNVYTWNGLLGGKILEEMTRSGTRPKAVTFLAILTACCHSGLVDEGFDNTMPMELMILILGWALLSACKAKGDIELSQEILDHLLKLKSQHSGAYVLLSNIYAINRRWVDVTRVRKLMKKKGIQKSPGSIGDTSHPQKDDIHMFLNILAKQIYLEGIFPIHS
ncbi:pentatricopeptide repeat-containing protein [Pyrus ussuriensis x Pyrus communis]|uniref:Pentatricopeptide repeat-containing protein n=1 Tax=Pyrus ussuriensis x Pyrus communis TaxID=2448454 RepID=A0A5N5F0F7_9ROSA|nr:pentatricopeptide repeat-containing protein [Pyrus ussuriensis x Pyrus communis]